MANQAVNDSLEDELKTTTGRVIIAGGSNARVVKSGMPHIDTKKPYILLMAIRTDLLIIYGC